MKLDILFCALPYSNLDHIYSAPAILKGVVVEHGYKACTVDFGCELFKLCNKNVELFTRVQQYFVADTADYESQQIIDQFYNLVIEYLKSNPATYVGFSVLSRYTHRAAWELLNCISNEKIDSKIIVGGRGSGVNAHKVFVKQFSLTQLEQTLTFGQVLEKRKLAEFVVYGDGEDAILDILNDRYTGIDSTDSDQFKSPVPNYDDYDFTSYLLDNGEISWPITGSKGCVRDCDFCDVAKHFGRYRFRTGADVANEMITVARQSGARKFMFTDSLVNGGLRDRKSVV